MRSLLVIFIIWATAARLAAAAEPALILTTPENILVYTLDDKSAQLKEKRSFIHPEAEPTSGAQALEDQSDRTRLLAAYLNGYLACGNGADRVEGRAGEQTPLARWIRQQTASPDQTARRYAELVVLPLRRGIVVVATQAGNHAVALVRKTGRRLAGSPCGAANRFYRVSPDRQRVVLVSQDVNGIEFRVSGETGENVTWEGNYADTMSVQMYDLAAPDKPLLDASSDEEPFDVYLPDEGNWRLISARHGTNWFNPMNWLTVIGGHAERRSDVFLKTYDAAGAPVGVQKIAKGVGLVQAHFVATAP